MEYKFGLTDLNRFNKWMKERDEFSFSTFGTPDKRNCIYPLVHLKKEVDELIDNPDDPLEWADCLNLLFDAARRHGISIDDLLGYAEKKLAINRKRLWSKQLDGTFRHIG